MPDVFSKGTPVTGRKGGYSKRLSYPGTCHQKQTSSTSKPQGNSRSGSRSLRSDQRLSPYRPNEGLFDRYAAVGIVSTNCDPDYDSDSELEGQSEKRTSSSRPHSRHGGHSQFRLPLMENTGLLNRHDPTVSGAFTGDDVETAPFPQSAMIIAMLQQQQHLLQEVIGSQQGMEEKQAYFEERLVSLQQQVSEGLNSFSSVSSSDDKKFKVTRDLTVSICIVSMILQYLLSVTRQKCLLYMRHFLMG